MASERVGDSSKTLARDDEQACRTVKAERS
jgi:hypothetical protein